MMRWCRLVAAAVAIPLTASALMLLPETIGLLPRALQDYPVEWAALALLLAFGLSRAYAASRPGDDPRAARLRRWLNRLDAGSARALDGGLTVAIGLLALGLLATWMPHYLTWPWARDVDTFATIAQSWDAGIRPYRDIRGYNFPGHIYLHWLIGLVFGWGHPTVFSALDAAALVALGCALWAWSRRRLGGPLPGLVAYVAFLGYYLGLEYHLVAERDWHATLAASLALMALESWPGRKALWVAAALEAAAFTIRPHAVLFLPAMAIAIAGQPRPVRALAEWGAGLGLFVAAGFAPLAMQGLLDDLVSGLRVAAYGGPYSRATLATGLKVLTDELSQPWNPVLIATLAVLWVSDCDRRRSAATWLVALLAALAYPALHPVQHGYLWLMPALIGSIALALPTARLSSLAWISRPIRVLGVLLILYEAVPQVPRFCLPRASLRALGTLARGTEPTVPPPGCLHPWFRPDVSHYRWSDYCQVLDYLRRETGPATQIANVLKHPPFPSLNGPVGRLSPFRAESGICWMWLVDLDLDAAFADALERTPDSVVVWSSAEIHAQPRLKLEQVTAVIRRHYRPAARFGLIEVWRRCDGEGSK
jgi:hypothetical protein